MGLEVQTRRRPNKKRRKRPHHYKAMGKCSYAVFSENVSGNVLFISRYSYIRLLSMTRMEFWPNCLSFGSFEVTWGRIRLLPLTFDRIEIEHWGWSQCVSLAQTHRLICNLTFLTSDLTWSWPEVKFWHWPCKVTMYLQHMSTRLDVRITMLPKLCH